MCYTDREGKYKVVGGMFVKKLFFSILLLGSIFMCITPVSAHRGGLDANGCHTCRTNCESYGLSYGEYHCHNGNSSSSSSSSSSSNSGTQNRSSQKAPVNYVYGCTDKDAYNYNEKANKDDGSCVAKKYGCIDKDAINFDSSSNMSDDSCQYKKEIIETKSIKFETKYKDNNELVQGNENIIKEGKAGKKKVTYDAIVDKNGKVISKKIINEEIVEKPIDKVIERGTGEASSFPALLWIISLVGTIIYSKKNKDAKLLWNKISNMKQPIKIILYIAYIMFIIPVFIDIIIVIIDLFKKIFKKDK